MKYTVLLCLLMLTGSVCKLALNIYAQKKTKIQSTLVVSKLRGPSETLRDIRISTYQICRIEENAYRTTKFHL